MINEINPNKNAFNLNIKKSETAKSESSAQTLKQSGLTQNVIPRSVSTPAGLGLPSDKLSSSIISFARFFSLPLKPQLLADIRRSAFVPAKTPSLSANVSASANTANAAVTGAQADSSTAVKFREALSLAAAAAESKGVELLPKGLESYAEAADPEWERRHDGQRRRRNKDQGRQDDESSVKIKSAFDSLTEPVTAGTLKKLYCENALNDPLLEILNRLPGKNAQRWIVLPFDLSQGSMEIKVSMRILTDDSYVSANACCMALDILIGDLGTGKEERMLFVMEAADNKPVKLFLYLWQALSQKEHKKIKQELSRAMEIPSERIFIKTSDESFPYETGCAHSSFFSFDEAV